MTTGNAHVTSESGVWTLRFDPPEASEVLVSRDLLITLIETQALKAGCSLVVDA